MARFISQYLKFGHGVRDGVPSHMGLNGIMVPDLPALSAEFSHNGITDKDVFIAKATFNFVGIPEDEAGNPIDPSYRVSVFDSEAAKLANGWSDEEEQLVCDALRAHPEYGAALVEILPEPTEAPWPNYDATDPEEIVKVAGLINADLEQALQYERENQARAGVIEALTEAAQIEPSEVVRA